MCLDEHHLENLKKLNYIPVGLGKNEYSKEWIRDNTGESISEKNPYYNMLEKKGNILQLSKKGKKNFFRRQDAPKVYDMTTFFYILKCKFIRKKNSIHQGKIGCIKIPRIRATDIDTVIDLEFAKFIKKNFSNY